MVKILVLNRIRNILGAMLDRGRKGSQKKSQKGKTVLFSLLYLWVAICMVFLSVSLSLSAATILIPLGLSWLYFAIFTIASLSILFIFSIFETKSELFDCKDNEFLLSMPIRPRDIVASRIVMVLIINYLVEAVMIIPALVFYAIFSGDALGVIGGIIVALFIPMLATALASIVGYAVAQIARLFRRSNFVTLLVSLVFLGAYFWFVTNILPNSDALILWLEGMDAGALAKNMPLLYMIGNASLLSPISLAFVVAVSTIVATAVYLVISKNYNKIITSSKGTKNAVYKEKKLVKGSVLSALVKRELCHFTSSAGYMLNTALGLVFEVVVAVVAVVKRQQLSEIFVQLFGSSDFISIIIASVMIILSSMNMLSASALSVESDRLWIVKSLPIDSRTLLLSKALPQILISLPFTVASAILLIVATNPSPIFWIFFFIIPIAANVCFAFLGINVNLLFPKFNYENEVQAAKQSLSSFITMISQMVLGFVAIVLAVVFSMFTGPLIAGILLFLVFAILSLLFGLLLLVSGVKKYDSIEV